MKKKLFYLSVGVVVLLGLGIQMIYPSPIPAKEVLKIGVITSLTGALSTHNPQYSRCIEMLESGVDKKEGYVDPMILSEIKSKGGILGRKLEFIVEDDNSDPATAVRKARKLVEQDGVKFIFGPPSSACALAISAMLPQWN